ncbi:uncharacterized protein EDB91DRAFT_1130613 [Suillus paluster]|uniref:uncharacterized protein n=1 Tax=Suillus paluster TaxID=48578 RepID=UPI001B866235|nr:uncharacterized protein EDB91DRAFT_1130613 [Suillus paluster]KAG1741470.1 hypothetical protein EDB91DRAFT_1130613 [Suillus paluster]
MEEVSSTLEAINEYTVISNSPLLPAFQVIQQFKSLPDVLMVPAILALMPHHHSNGPTPKILEYPPSQGRSMRILHAMHAFVAFANKARERSRPASGALKYACQNWAFHLSRALKPWDDTLHCIFKSFWNRALLSWLERQWCLNGLQSCLVILSEGQKLATEHLLDVSVSSQPSVTKSRHSCTCQ